MWNSTIALVVGLVILALIMPAAAPGAAASLIRTDNPDEQIKAKSEYRRA